MDLFSTGPWVIRLGGYNASAASFTPNEPVSQGRAHSLASSRISLGFPNGLFQPASLSSQATAAAHGLLFHTFQYTGMLGV